MYQVPISDTFEQAEKLRIDGKPGSAITVYKTLLEMIDDTHELWIPVNHMLAVSLKSAAESPDSGELLEADHLLERLLNHGILSPLQRGQVLRDRADVARKEGRHLDIALQMAQQSYEGLMLIDDVDPAEPAASLGFMSRIEFTQNNVHTARVLAEAAMDMFEDSQMSSPTPQLHHLLWYIRILANAGDPDEAEAELRAACQILASGTGNSDQCQALDIMAGSLGDIDLMEASLADAGCF